MYLISDVLKWDLYKNNVFEYLPIDFASQKFKTMAGNSYLYITGQNILKIELIKNVHL